MLLRVPNAEKPGRNVFALPSAHLRVCPAIAKGQNSVEAGPGKGHPAWPLPGPMDAAECTAVSPWVRDRLRGASGFDALRRRLAATRVTAIGQRTDEYCPRRQ